MSKLRADLANSCNLPRCLGCPRYNLCRYEFLIGYGLSGVMLCVEFLLDAHVLAGGFSPLNSSSQLEIIPIGVER
jgi:hypothetical protein